MAGGEPGRAVTRPAKERGPAALRSWQKAARTAAGAGLGAAALALVAGTALAQEPGGQEAPALGPEAPVLRPPARLPSVSGPQGQGIQGIEQLLNRAPVDYLPLGLRAGTFLIFPQLTTGVAFDDNIFETENNAASDVIFGLNPGVTAVSTWSRHELVAFADAQILRYWAKGDQDTEAFGVGLTGRYDVTRASALNGTFVFRRANESATDPAVANRRFPTQYDALGLEAGYNYSLGIIGLGITADYTQYDFLESIDRTRDRYEVRVSPRASYSFSPNLSVFVQPSYTSYNYDELGSVQDFDTIDSLFGVQFTFTGALTGDAGVGFTHQLSDNPRLDGFTGFIARGAVTWTPTALTQVTGSVSRDVTPSSDATVNGAVVSGLNSQSLVRTAATLNVQHDILRNARVSVQGSVFMDDFSGANRTDYIYDAQVGGQYLLNRNVSVFVNYEYTNRDSDLANNSFSKNLVLFGVRGAL